MIRNFSPDRSQIISGSRSSSSHVFNLDAACFHAKYFICIILFFPPNISWSCDLGILVQKLFFFCSLDHRALGPLVEVGNELFMNNTPVIWLAKILVKFIIAFSLNLYSLVSDELSMNVVQNANFSTLGLQAPDSKAHSHTRSRALLRSKS